MWRTQSVSDSLPLGLASPAPVRTRPARSAAPPLLSSAFASVSFQSLSQAVEQGL